MPLPTLGEILYEFRRARNMSRASFAKRAGVDPSTVYNIEKGRTSALRTDQFERVAQVMGMSAEELTLKTNGGGEHANGRIAELAGEIPPALFARVLAVAQARGKPWGEWLEAAVASAEKSVAAAADKSNRPTWTTGQGKKRDLPAVNRRRRQKASGQDPEPGSESGSAT